MALSIENGIAAWNSWGPGTIFNNPTSKQVLEFIKSHDLDKVILFNQFEFEFSLIPYLQEILYELHIRNKRLIVVNGCEAIFMPHPYWNIDLYRYPNNTMARAYYRILDPHLLQKHGVTKNERIISNPENIDYKFHFVSLNNRGHQHRKEMIDLLAQHNLIDNNAISWHNEHVTIHHRFKYFDGRKITLTDDYTNDKEQSVVPLEYYQSFAQLVVESTLDALIVTEKTATPLILGKPFLSASCPLFHRHLEKLGFLPYDEIFDYSFDTVFDRTTRFQMIVDNFTRLSTIPLYQLKELAKKIKDKLEHNKKMFEQVIFRDLENYPQPIQDIIKIYDDQKIELDNLTINHHLRLKQAKEMLYK